MELHPEVALAIDLAAREVAKSFTDHYERGADYASIKRSIGGFISMAVAKSAMKDELVWTTTSTGAMTWLISAADGPAGSIDPEAFSRAINKWWDSLDAAGQIEAITQHAGHHKSEYINNITQKYKDKPEALLAKEIPALDAAYKAERGGAAAPAPAPAAPAAKPAPDVPVIPPSAPAEE